MGILKMTIGFLTMSFWGAAVPTLHFIWFGLILDLVRLGVGGSASPPLVAWVAERVMR